ncbi:MAG: succinate dehydrogenase, cytochrome b556 subunit [Gammaproteobacteria bacterium]|nr:succinate dehydrogenase, cytochrome b556 subunit [Gammaproteobacteria bacterium]
MYKTTGFLSFVLRRFTGVALVLYLILHIWVIGSALSGAETFNERLNFLQTDLFKILEIGLLAAVVYHAFDGVRLLLVNWFKVTERRKSLFYSVMIISALMVIAGGVPILLFMLEGK